MLAVSLLLTAAAAGLLVGPVTGGRARWASAAPDGALRTGRTPTPARQAGLTRVSVLLAATSATLWALSSAVTTSQLAVAVLAVGSAAAVARMVAASRRAEAAARRRRSVVDFCEALVGELRAGQPVLAALERSAPVWPEAAPVVATARLDGDVPGALHQLSRAPGAGSLGHLAAAWQLCTTTGGGLTSAAALVLESARADEAALRQVEGEAASARATARLVAALPVIVLSAGEGLGAHPWAFLLGRPPGLICLASGLALLFAGLAWIDRIAVAATSGDG
jgi:tight adherence protein B